MPRGGGLIYDYPILRDAILEFLVGLEMGDIYDGRDLVTHLSTYRGLSRKDKRKAYVLKEHMLIRSSSHFIQIANRIIEKDELPIVQKNWTKKYSNQYTVMGHEPPLRLPSSTKRMYLRTGD